MIQTKMPHISVFNNELAVIGALYASYESLGTVHLLGCDKDIFKEAQEIQELIVRLAEKVNARRSTRN